MRVSPKAVALLAALTAALTAGGAALVLPRAASAVSAPATLPAGQFSLRADYHRFDALNAALTTTLGAVPVHTVMANANHSRRSITDALGLSGYTGGFRFDATDDSDCTNYPQGITTSRDAAGTANGGTYDGHQLVLVSWYTKAGCDGAGTRSRITLVDWDATYPNTYRKILLVEPTGTASAPSFKDVPVHAGGVAWYGDLLYVADTAHGMRVFDLRRILRTDTGGRAGQIGRQSATVYYAHNYAYVLPQVGTVTAATTSGTPLAWSSISLDRPTRSLVMNEYTCPAGSGCTAYPDRAPRAVRFPFAAGATTFAASTTATEALRLPWYRLNGVASHNRRWWFNSSGDKKLYSWAAGGAARTYGWVGGGESISYWEDATKPDLLWSLQETAGHRNVFTVKQASYSP